MLLPLQSLVQMFILRALQVRLHGNHATYWKNGVPTDLSANKSEQTIATGIAVAGTDVYVVGYFMENGSSSPAYWKDGTEVKISGGGLINAICVSN